MHQPPTQLLRALPLAVAVAVAMPSAAVEISTDVTVDLAGSVAHDEDVVEDPASTPAFVDLGTLPTNADVVGHSVTADGDELFVLDISTSLPGGIDVTPRDVIRWDGASHSVEFDGTSSGVPSGARIDAVGLVDGDLMLSFDVTVSLGGITAADEDLLRLEETSPDSWVLFFDGSAEGVPAGADLDGADWIDGTQHLGLSFDISGSVGGVAFDDDDVLDFDRTARTWSKHFDGTTAALEAADVDAVFVPEPAAGSLAALAAAAVLLLRAQRAFRPRG